MHADDIAGNIQNPHVGKVFNSYNGPDVYHGLPKVLAPPAKFVLCTSHVLANVLARIVSCTFNYYD